MLTPKQTRFVAEYLIDLNGTQATIRAGYSPKSAAFYASALLRTDHKVAAAVAAAQAARASKAGITAERVLQEVARLAFSDLRGLFDEHGNLKGIHELTADQAATVASMEVVKGNIDAGDDKRDTIHKLKVWDKVKALDLAMQHLGLTKGNGTPVGEIILRWAGGN